MATLKERIKGVRLELIRVPSVPSGPHHLTAWKPDLFKVGMELWSRAALGPLATLTDVK